MRILITGGDGFIGSHLAELWRRSANPVAVLDNWETGIQRPGTYECDVADRDRLYRFANKVQPELVVHCAASYKDPNKWHRDVETNVTGTINATLVAKHHEAKIVYFQTALPPISSYAISKIAGEQYIRQSGVPHLIFRLANIYGPRNLSGPVPAFYKRLNAGQPCTVVQTSRDMLYISDLVSCVVHALTRGSSGTYDVCSGQKTAIAAIYGEVASYFDPAPMAEFVAPSADDVDTELSVERTLANWKPVVPLHEGIEKAIEWYAEHGVGETYTHLKIGGKA